MKDLDREVWKFKFKKLLNDFIALDAPFFLAYLLLVISLDGLSIVVSIPLTILVVVYNFWWVKKLVGIMGYPEYVEFKEYLDKNPGYKRVIKEKYGDLFEEALLTKRKEYMDEE